MEKVKAVNIIEAIADRVRQNQGGERDPNRPDYTDEDGLLHCGVCKEKKQTRIQLEDRQLVVPCICKCRREELEQEKRQKEHQEQLAKITRLKDSSLMSSKYRDATFAGYLIRPENEKASRIARNYVDKFDTMRQNNQGLIFYGPVGTGKSYTAACIANALLDNAISVVMTSFVKILQDIQGGKIPEAEYIGTLNSASLLIIDDLGAERNTDYALEKVYNVIDSRVRTKKPMILTTNLSMKEMKQPQDVRYKRVYDRIFEVCYPVQMLGQSFRMAEAARRYEQMKNILET